MTAEPSPIDGALLMSAAPPAVHARSRGPALAGPVTGTCRFADGTSGQLAGTFTVTEFRASSAVLRVTGTLTATCSAVTGTGSSFAQEVTTAATTAVTPGPGTCWTLRLVVGETDLDREEQLVVHTDDAVISVSVESGPGHLPGNLLAAVGNAVTSGAPATHVAELLNQFVAISR